MNKNEGTKTPEQTWPFYLGISALCKDFCQNLIFQNCIASSGPRHPSCKEDEDVRWLSRTEKINRLGRVGKQRRESNQSRGHHIYEVRE